jgi:hypothetical protein
MFGPTHLNGLDTQTFKRVNVQVNCALKRQHSDTGKSHLGAPIHE